MGLVSPIHLLVLGLVAVLLFGAKRLPEMARSLGTGMREFKTSIAGEEPTLIPPPEAPQPPSPMAELTIDSVDKNALIPES
jgi:sec-independent protein translocase protein TatA